MLSALPMDMTKHTVTFVVHTDDKCDLQYELARFLWGLNQQGRDCDPNTLTIEGGECTASCCVDEEEE